MPRVIHHNPTDEGGHAPDAWVDAGVDAAYAFDRYAKASTPLDQAHAMVELSNAMASFKSWLPGVDDHGDMPWDRGDDTYYERRDAAPKPVKA